MVSNEQIVDFCCGSNDFSIIMKKKLEETGKKCYYKNYDIIQPKVIFVGINSYIGQSHGSYYRRYVNMVALVSSAQHLHIST